MPRSFPRYTHACMLNPYRRFREPSSANEIESRFSPNSRLAASFGTNRAAAKRCASFSISSADMLSGVFITRCPSSLARLKRFLSGSTPALITMTGTFSPHQPDKPSKRSVGRSHSITITPFASADCVRLATGSSPNPHSLRSTLAASSASSTLVTFIRSGKFTLVSGNSCSHNSICNSATSRAKLSMASRVFAGRVERFLYACQSTSRLGSYINQMGGTLKSRDKAIRIEALGVSSPRSSPETDALFTGIPARPRASATSCCDIPASRRA